MIIAIPVEDLKKGKVAPTFGRTTDFLLYDTQSGKRSSVENVKRSTEEDIGVSSAQVIVNNNVDVLITALCRDNSAEIFKKANIKVYKTAGDSVEDNLRAYLTDSLTVFSEA